MATLLPSSKSSVPLLRLAGFWRQLQILIWKNLMLAKANKISTILEIFMSLAFISLLILIRYIVERPSRETTSNYAYNVVDYFHVLPNRNLILYYPNNEFVRQLALNSYNIIKSRKSWLEASVKGVDSPDPSLLNSTLIDSLIAFIVFPANYSFYLPPNIQYTLHTQEQTNYEYHIEATLYPKQEYLFGKAPESLCNNKRFFQAYNTFNALKLALDFAIIQQYSSVEMRDAEQVKIQALDCPAYNVDELKSTFVFLTAVILEIAYLFTLLVTVSYLVGEKQSKMKEYLGIMGIRWYISAFAWFLRSMAVYLVMSAMAAMYGSILLQRRMDKPYFQSKALFAHTHWSVIFFVCVVYSLQTSLFALFISQIFSKSFLAKIASILVWVVSGINFYESIPSQLKYAFCFIPNVTLNLCLQVIFQHERSEKSLILSNLSQNLFDDPLNVASVLLAAVCWSFLFYIPLIWYFEKVMPGKFGIALPFYFPFTASYWQRPQPETKPDVTIGDLFKLSPENSFEEEPTHLDATVRIQNLFKKFQFRQQRKTAVNNLSLNIYEDQVTGLLGHNGAGKTTTIFMLCGIYETTSGSVRVYDFDLGTQLDLIRPLLGFVPQHDILYEELTIYEHLDLIASIKGFPKKLVNDEILRISTYVGLEKDLQKKSKTLSGGMKRRLSVAMSFIGDSKLIIMDEPTSGLDPLNRRLLWELIQRHKLNRTIILTTHFMDEADALCDRIAILNSGTVVCSGSPAFLKNKFGHGFKLQIIKSKVKPFDFSGLQTLLGLHLESGYQIETDIASEMTIGLSSEDGYILPAFLSKINENKDVLGVDSFGISSTTIEEVFLKMSQIKTVAQKSSQIPSEEIPEEVSEPATTIQEKEKLSSVFSSSLSLSSGVHLQFMQLRALLRKRVILFYRHFLLAGITLFLPLLFEIVFTALIPSQTYLINQLSDTKIQTSGDYQIDLKNYPKPTHIPYYLTGRYSHIPAKNLLKKFYTSERRPGLKLVNISTDTVPDYIYDMRRTDLKNFVGDYFFGMRLNITTSNKIHATLYYSTMAFHTSATVLNEMTNMLLALTSKNFDTSITTFNSPIASNDSLYTGSDFFQYLACVDVLPVSILNMLNSLLIAFIMGIMAIHVAKERLNGSKSLQLLTGTHFLTYWTSNYIFDMIICTFNVTSLLLVIKVMTVLKNDETNELWPISNGDAFYVTWLMFAASSWCWCAFAYSASFLFKSDVVAFIGIFIVSSVAGFIDMIASFVYLFVRLDNFGKATFASELMNFFRYILTILFPNVTLKRTLYNLKIRDNEYCIKSLNSVLKTEYRKNRGFFAFEEPGVGMMLFLTVLQFVTLNCLLLGYEGRFYFSWRWLTKLKEIVIRSVYRRDDSSLVKVPFKLKSNVLKESERIDRADLGKLTKLEPLVIKNLYKKFTRRGQTFLATNNLSFGIKRNECFGLLGLNGAGKTTLLKILIGDLRQTSGQVYINGFDLNLDYAQARQNLGYCPQFDYLPDYLTVRECLGMFASLKGISKHQVDMVIADLVSVFVLHEFSDKIVKNLSGGNRRKVSSAIAFLGSPKLVILDEPTTGMDPASRRYFWNLIRKASEFGITVILTSHSMEECEALCTKLGILSKGQFKTLGTSAYIKSKYGKGFSFSVKCRRRAENEFNQIKAVEDYILASIPRTCVKDRQQETLFFQCESTETPMADIFYHLETNRDNLDIESFAVSETTLEQVFMILEAGQTQKAPSATKFKSSDQFSF